MASRLGGAWGCAPPRCPICDVPFCACIARDDSVLRVAVERPHVLDRQTRAALPVANPPNTVGRPFTQATYKRPPPPRKKRTP
jgi:hypothetical protein